MVFMDRQSHALSHPVEMIIHFPQTDAKQLTPRLIPMSIKLATKEKKRKLTSMKNGGERVIRRLNDPVTQTGL